MDERTGERGVVIGGVVRSEHGAWGMGAPGDAMRHGRENGCGRGHGHGYEHGHGHECRHERKYRHGLQGDMGNGNGNAGEHDDGEEQKLQGARTRNKKRVAGNKS